MEGEIFIKGVDKKFAITKTVEQSMTTGHLIYILYNIFFFMGGRRGGGITHESEKFPL